MSDAKVLFEITEKHLNTGLRRFPVGTVRTSRVDPDEGVSYVGYPVKDLAYLIPKPSYSFFTISSCPVTMNWRLSKPTWQNGPNSIRVSSSSWANSQRMAIQWNG